MSYTNHFKNEVVDRYKTAPTARALLQRMGSLEDKHFGEKSPEITVTQHRIAEIDECSDWGESYTQAPWFILHHARNASDELGRIINNWMSPVCTHGLRDLHNEATDSVKSIRRRIDPTLYGIEKELDPCRAARAAYDELEDKSLQAINVVFDPATTAHMPKDGLHNPPRCAS